MATNGANVGGDQSDLAEFLSKYGRVEVLVNVDTDGVRFKDLDEQVGVSHDALSKYLLRGEELGLFERQAREGERTHRWVVTPLGARLKRQLKLMDASGSFKLLGRFRQQCEEHTEDLQQWIVEQEAAGELNNQRRNAHAHELLRGDDPVSKRQRQTEE